MLSFSEQAQEPWAPEISACVICASRQDQEIREGEHLLDIQTNQVDRDGETS
jgi:hypothetical protein